MKKDELLQGLQIQANEIKTRIEFLSKLDQQTIVGEIELLVQLMHKTTEQLIAAKILSQLETKKEDVSVSSVNENTMVNEIAEIIEESDKEQENQNTQNFSSQEIIEDENHIELIGEKTTAKLNDEDNSLVGKFQRSAIKDLVASLSINDKILFTKELFNGDSSAFIEAINQLNSKNEKESAIDYFKNQLQSKYQWEEESEPYIRLLNLIERRYV